jgi:hypothetical protein
MKEEWEERIICATQCSRCHGRLDRRILSVYVLIALRVLPAKIGSPY